MASGSLPPGFPAALIEGEYYWDGGLISNTALQWVVDKGPRQDTLAFQVDLWSARGELPRNLAEVATRLKEIQYSSRTRAKTAILSRGDCLERRLDRTGGSVIGASRLLQSPTFRCWRLFPQSISASTSLSASARSFTTICAVGQRLERFCDDCSLLQRVQAHITP
jgi:predicted acylesterase/phospholipase RssA